MTVNLATAVYKSTGSTTGRSLGARAADIINVKDYGAVGDGSHDDTTNIQAAIDAAFGPASSPHGNTNRFQNVPLYFPSGNYNITAPLYFTHVVGGWIFGGGADSTRIAYSGALSGNTVVANGQTPIFMTNGFKYSKFEGLNLAISGASTCGFYLFQDGTKGDSTGNTFSELLIESAAAGILAGFQGDGNECSECLYINVTFSGCGYGLRTVNANALNHSVYGGGGNSCTTACYSQAGGNISPICDASLAGNTLDFDIHGSVPVSLIGGRSESTNCLFASGTQVYMNGFFYQPGTPGTFVDVSNSSCAVMDNCYSNPGVGAHVLVALGNSGRAILDAFTSNSGSTGTISGTAGSNLYLRGCSFSNTNTITGFSGTVAQNI